MKYTNICGKDFKNKAKAYKFFRSLVRDTVNTDLNCVEPTYPKLAIKRGYEGVLKLEITILKNGKVKDVFIKESTGFEILDKAGINAAKNSKFYPLNKNTNLKIEYTLKLNRR